jgi:hypothetical protein
MGISIAEERMKHQWRIRRELKLVSDGQRFAEEREDRCAAYDGGFKQKADILRSG